MTRRDSLALAALGLTAGDAGHLASRRRRRAS